MDWNSKLKIAAVAAIVTIAAACAVAAPAQAQTTEGYWQQIQKRGVLRCGVGDGSRLHCDDKEFCR